MTALPAQVTVIETTVDVVAVNQPPAQVVLADGGVPAVVVTVAEQGPPGPPGPAGGGSSAVSADPGNMATLGSDNLVYVTGLAPMLLAGC